MKVERRAGDRPGFVVTLGGVDHVLSEADGEELFERLRAAGAGGPVVAAPSSLERKGHAPALAWAAVVQDAFNALMRHNFELERTTERFNGEVKKALVELQEAQGFTPAASDYVTTISGSKVYFHPLVEDAAQATAWTRFQGWLSGVPEDELEYGRVERGQRELLGVQVSLLPPCVDVSALLGERAETQ